MVQLVNNKNHIQRLELLIKPLKHSHQLLYKCVKYTFWPLLHILNQITLHISLFKNV